MSMPSFGEKSCPTRPYFRFQRPWLDTGRGEDPNYKEAVVWYQIAAETECLMRKIILGGCTEMATESKRLCAGIFLVQTSCITRP